MDILGEQTKDRGEDITAGALQTILNKYFSDVPEDASTITKDTILTSKEGGYEIPLSDIYDGEIKISGIAVGDMTEEEKKEIIGKYVTNYECASNDAIETTAPGKWMIFNIDEDNIYLIASDYINTDYCPTKDGATVTKSSSYPRGASFSGVYSKYAGSTDVSDIGKQLNKSYFIDNNYSSTNSNMKSVAYMLDTNAWSGFAGENAEYAIGGPTIELFFEAYNKAHGSTANQYQARAKSSTGYEITTDGGTTWGNYTSTAGGNYLATNDPTFVINSPSNAYGMWVASPSATYAGHVLNVDYGGDVSYDDCSLTGGGFRPLVSLKSDVELRKTGDNTYEIIE